uniref:Leucine rich immune protein (Coil-less) n=1 Tax=Anopheles atroparvus TaxID=41427 RepID=A0A182IVU4_ANOAO
MGVAMIVALVFLLFAVKLADTEIDKSSKNDVYVKDPRITVAPSEVMRDCSLPTTVNYRIPYMEFTISFDCSLAPFSNEHSQKVFRKVSSYRLDGRTVCCDVGVGLQYLHFPHNIRLLVLDGYCINSLPPDTFQQFDSLERLEITASQFEHLASVNFRQLLSLKELLLENNEFGTMESGTIDVLVQL